MPVVIVGGGSVLVDERRKLKGTSSVIKPPYYQVKQPYHSASHCIVSGKTVLRKENVVDVMLAGKLIMLGIISTTDLQILEYDSIPCQSLTLI